MASTDTAIETKPLMRAGSCLPLAYATRTISVSAIRAEGTAMMYDGANEEYVEADITTAGSANTLGWSILGEDVAADATSAKIYTSGVIDEEDVVVAGATLTAMNEEAKILFKMNGIDISQSKTV